MLRVVAVGGFSLCADSSASRFQRISACSLLMPLLFLAWRRHLAPRRPRLRTPT